MKNMKLWMLAAILVISGTMNVFAQLQRTAAFHEKYPLKQAVVLSRHNIRSPISTKESLLFLCLIGSAISRLPFDISVANASSSLIGLI